MPRAQSMSVMGSSGGMLDEEPKEKVSFKDRMKSKLMGGSGANSKTARRESKDNMEFFNE